MNDELQRISLGTPVVQRVSFAKAMEAHMARMAVWREMGWLEKKNPSVKPIRCPLLPEKWQKYTVCDFPELRERLPILLQRTCACGLGGGESECILRKISAGVDEEGNRINVVQVQLRYESVIRDRDVWKGKVNEAMSWSNLWVMFVRYGIGITWQFVRAHVLAGLTCLMPSFRSRILKT